MSLYILVKFVHILVAIVAVGSSAGSSLWLRLAMKDEEHLPFALRTSHFLDDWVTRPGLFLLLLTGLWMAATHWTLSLLWVRAALVLVVLVLALLYALVGPIHNAVIRAAERNTLKTEEGKRLELLFELAGGGSGLLIILVVWLMVAKPS